MLCNSQISTSMRNISTLQLRVNVALITAFRHKKAIIFDTRLLNIMLHCGKANVVTSNSTVSLCLCMCLCVVNIILDYGSDFINVGWNRVIKGQTYFSNSSHPVITWNKSLTTTITTAVVLHLTCLYFPHTAEV